MTIYVIPLTDGYVYFKFYDSNRYDCAEEFEKAFGKAPRTTREDALCAMEEIDDWYMDKYFTGCVRFEFA